MSRPTNVLNYTPAMMGINGLALTAARTSNWIPVNGAEAIVIDLEHTNTSGALTITGTFQVRKFSDTNPKGPASKFTAAGVETLSARTFSWAVTGSAYLRYIFDGLKQGDDEFRLFGIIAAGAAATDLISVGAEVTVLQ